MLRMDGVTRSPRRANAHSGLPGAAVAMVGDDVRDDVMGALAAGYGAGVLVQTGKCVGFP